METIRASSLNSFRMCPRRFFEDVQEFNPINTFLWTIVHMWIRWIDYKPLLNYYFTNINTDIKLMEIIKKLIDKWMKRRSETFKKSLFFEDEIWMIIKYNDNYFIEWTVDALYMFKDELEVLHIEDYKTCSSMDSYSDWSILETNAQHYIYTWLVYEYYNPKDVVFTYRALEKKNTARMEWYSFNISREEATTKARQIIDDYIFSKESWIYEEKKNSFCYKLCWLRNVCNAFRNN